MFKYIDHMTGSNILQQRLYNQQVTHQSFQRPAEVVEWFGAMQAQDYHGVKWAIALRLKGITDADIEQAIADKKIVRTWPMRRTLHFVSPEDIRWMLQLLTPRIISRSATLYRQLELDKKLFSKCKKLFANALQGEKQLTRNEIYEILEQAKISTKAMRGLHILCHLAQEGFICFAARKGKQPTFALLDEWVLPIKPLTNDEALALLTKKYFTSHGPATINDFAWWSGLTIADVKRGIEMIKSDLQNEMVNSQQYWMRNNIVVEKIRPQRIFLLPSFDEYLVAYKDRSLAVHTTHTRNIFGANGIFNPVILVNNKVEGTWKRSFKKNKLQIEINLFSELTKAKKDAVAKAVKKYSKFTGAPNSFNLIMLNKQ